jgi:hypothetical protein
MTPLESDYMAHTCDNERNRDLMTLGHESCTGRVRRTTQRRSVGAQSNPA